MKYVLSLASSSPRRRQLISLGGWMFNLLPIEIDETPRSNEKSLDYVQRMAREKALAAAPKLRPGGIAITADTTVADGDDILGKPMSIKQAQEMLFRLRGRVHHVHTAIGIIRQGETDVTIDLCTTAVPMRSYSDEEIFTYVSSGDPFDKAGGYAIQSKSFKPVGQIGGCYANVVGLPLCHLVRTLEKMKISPRSNVPEECQKSLQYHCPVYKQVLQGEL